MIKELGTNYVMGIDRPAGGRIAIEAASYPCGEMDIVWPSLIHQPEFRLARQYAEGLPVGEDLDTMAAASDYFATSVQKALDELCFPVVHFQSRWKRPDRIVEKAESREAHKPWRERLPLQDYYGALVVVPEGQNPSAVTIALNHYYGMPTRDNFGRDMIVVGRRNPDSDPSYRNNKVFINFTFADQHRQGEVQVYDEQGWLIYQKTRVGYEQRRTQQRRTFEVSRAGQVQRI